MRCLSLSPIRAPAEDHVFACRCCGVHLPLRDAHDGEATQAWMCRNCHTFNLGIFDCYSRAGISDNVVYGHAVHKPSGSWTRYDESDWPQWQLHGWMIPAEPLM